MFLCERCDNCGGVCVLDTDDGQEGHLSRWEAANMAAALSRVQLTHSTAHLLVTLIDILAPSGRRPDA